MRRALLIAAAVLITAGAAGQAKERAADKPPETPALFRQLTDCRAIADAAQRLACYDRQVAALDAATQSREIVIADKQQVRQARRGLFGFTAPLGRLLGIGGGDDDAEEIKRLETTVTEVRRTREGALKLVFGENGTWEQIDTRSFGLTPRVGNKAVISKGALGSYIISVDGMPGIKFRRVE